MKTKPYKNRSPNQNYKNKYRQNAQHQLLSNYYLSKYDKYMSKYSDNDKSLMSRFESQKNQPFQNQSNSYQKNNKHMDNNPSNKKRVNFKAVLLDKKYKTNLTASNEKLRHSSKEKNGGWKDSRKNFKQQIESKHSKQKKSRIRQQNFRKLQGSIINQLYSPSPSKFQSGKHASIEIKQKTTYGQQLKSQPSFMIYGTQNEDDNIHIYRQKDYGRFRVIEQHQQFPENVNGPQQSYFSINSQKQKQQLSLIEKGIRSSFQRRNSNSRSPRKQSRQKKVQIFNTQQSRSQQSNQNNYDQYNAHSIQWQQKQINQNSHIQDSLHYENIRPGFLNMTRNIRNNSPSQSGSKSKNNALDKSRNQDDPLSKTKNSKKIHSSRKNSLNKSIHVSRKNSYEFKRNEQSFDDSLNESPHIQQSVPPFPTHQRRPSFGQKTARSNDRPPTQLKQSMHQLSMISRFSMTSDEGGYIRQHLQRQINENQLGPYQQALTNLKQLIDEFPNAWPIYVVGQRILEDRCQYDNKRQLQNQQIAHLENKIENVNRKIRKRQQISTDIDNNSRTILFLIRKLAGELDINQ